MDNPNTFKPIGAELNSAPIGNNYTLKMVSTSYHCNTIFLTVNLLFFDYPLNRNYLRFLIN